MTSAPLPPASKDWQAFTLIELMVVISIIGLALAFVVPALAPATGRSLEGSARQFTADLENARQIAIAERTKTRLLIPDKNPASGQFGAESSELALRGYTMVSFNKSANTWKQRGKWMRLILPATFDPAAAAPATATEEGIIATRKTETTPVDNSSSGTAATKTFTGAYVEFRSNGATSLDPASKTQVLMLVDGIPDGNGNMRKKNSALHYQVTIDPLTGSARLK